jgi:hypothetical protein
MAGPTISTSGSSMYPFSLACALIVLSLWSVDIGLVGRSSFNRTTVLATSARPKLAYQSRSQLYGLLSSMLEQSRVGSSSGLGPEAHNEEVRRLAALALLVYVNEDGIRR